MVTQEVSCVPDIPEVWAKLSRWKKFLVDRGRSVSIGKYNPPGFHGETEFFIFRCKNCGGLSIDYLHGFEPDQYLSCHHC